MSESSNVRAGGAYVELYVKNSISPQLLRAQAAMKAFSAGAFAAGAKVRTAGMYIAGIGTAMLGAAGLAVHAFVGIGTRLDQLSKQSGLSSELLSELNVEIENAGGSAETFAIQALRMQKAIFAAQDATSAQAVAFAELGLDAKKLLALSPDDQFLAIADALSKVKNPTELAGLAFKIFGRGIAPLIPLLKVGGDELQRYRERARALGLSISGETAKGAHHLGNEIRTLTEQVHHAVAAIGEALAPSLESFIRGAQVVVGKITHWIHENEALVNVIKTVAVYIAAFGGIIIGLSAVFSIIGFAVGAVAPLFGAFAAILKFVISPVAIIGGMLHALADTIMAVLGGALAFIISPIGIFISLVAAATAAIFYFTDAGATLSEQFSQTWGEIARVAKDTIGGIVDALKAGDVALAGQIAMQGLKTALMAGWTGIKALWIRAIYSLAEAWEVIYSTAVDVFDRLATAIKNLYSSAVTAVAKGITSFARMLGIDELVLGVKLSDKEIEQMFNTMDQGTAKENAQRSAELARRQSAREKELEDAIKALEDNKDGELSANQTELEAMKAKLEALRSTAQHEREAKQIVDDSKKLAVPKTPKIDAGITKAVDEVQKKLSSRGTFNISGAAGLLASENHAAKIAENTKRTADNTDKLVDSMGDGGTFE